MKLGEGVSTDPAVPENSTSLAAVTEVGTA
jgi:hypothetical protein